MPTSVRRANQLPATATASATLFSMRHSRPRGMAACSGCPCWRMPLTMKTACAGLVNQILAGANRGHGLTPIHRCAEGRAAYAGAAWHAATMPLAVGDTRAVHALHFRRRQGLLIDRRRPRRAASVPCVPAPRRGRACAPARSPSAGRCESCGYYLAWSLHTGGAPASVRRFPYSSW